MIRLFGLLGLLAFSIGASAQSWTRNSSLEFGLMVGGSNYTGELVDKFFEPEGTHMAIGIFTRYNPVQRLTFKLQANYGKISGDDRWYGEDEVRAARNLHFESVLWDFKAGLDVNLNTLGFKVDKGTIPYLTFGVSVFKFNPQAQFFYDPNSWHSTSLSNYAALESRHEDWVELQPLGTEGQETTEYNEKERYALTQFAIPLGLGVKFKLNRHWTFGIEHTTHFTFTDFMDDVSDVYVEPVFLEAQYGPMSPAMADRGAVESLANQTRGDASNKDWYNIFGVSLSYRIYTSKVNCFQF